MKVSKISFDTAGRFTPLFLDYINSKPSLSPFYELGPVIENFKKKMEQLNFPEERRKVLQDVLYKQYQGFEIKEKVSLNIKSIEDSKTFTVTTGHQLNIFTGPLYFIYKIVTSIRLAQELKKKYPEYHFIPVYWMASEDHDFEEINHFNLFGKRFEWKTAQTGPVGKFDPSGIGEIFKELPEKLPLFEQAYRQHKTLSQATRYLVNELFGETGLLIIDGDDKILKKEFKEIIKQELTPGSSFAIVQNAIDKLNELGYKTQVNPREINLFYIEDSLRERIVKEEGKYKVLNTGLSFSEAQILKIAEENPEKFSPNVILRPLYENFILPDLAYIGGPAEVSYWLQLKELFSHYKVSFPIVMPRNFVLYINKPNYKKLSKLQLQEEHLFLEEHELKEKYLRIIDGVFDMEKEKKNLEVIFEEIKLKSYSIDKSLEGFVLAERQKMTKILEEIEKKLKKSEEKKQETEISQVINLKLKLFPGGALQERTENFLNFYINDPDFLNKMLSLLDPLDFRLNIIAEND